MRGVDPPPVLFTVEPWKLVGLTIDAEQLAGIRRRRVRTLAGAGARYADLAEIYEELEFTRALHRRLGCPVIDVTGLAIEETAARVAELVDERRRASLEGGALVTDGYDIHLDDKYGQLRLIDVAAEAAAHEPWFNQTLTSVNDAVVRLGVIEGEFHWHSHDAEDEFFLVVEGELVIEIEGAETVRLGPLQGYTVPKGVAHKTSAPTRTVDRDGRAGRRRPHRRLTAWIGYPSTVRPATQVELHQQAVVPARAADVALVAAHDRRPAGSRPSRRRGSPRRSPPPGRS